MKKAVFIIYLLGLTASSLFSQQNDVPKDNHRQAIRNEHDEMPQVPH